MSFRKIMAPVLFGAVLVGLSATGPARAQLPPEVEADRLLLIARDSMEAQDWAKARDAFEGILALGIAVPPDFHYHYARALSQSGRPVQAKEELTLYLGKADRGSETYRDALALFNTVDAAARRMEEAERKEAAAAARKTEDARKTTARIAEAEAGDVDAQEVVGTWYMYGTNGVKRDYAQARKWLERAAAQEQDMALAGLAFLYVNGWGVPKDFAKAHGYYIRAARKNNVHALHGLGVMYANGHGVRKDPVVAAQWYRKGAEAGSTESMNNLAGLYMKGEGVPLNRDVAYELYLKAGKLGHKGAQKNIQTLFGGFHNWN